MITKRQMGLAMPTAAKSGRLDIWYDPLVAAMEECQITTPNRIADFMGNLAEESGELQAMEENLHYSAARIRQVFTGLTDGGAKADEAAAGGPEGVANYVYADEYRPEGYKMGNSYPGSGWRNRGRGPNQITGEGNYRAYFKSVNMDEDSDRDLLLQPTHGALSAAMFWRSHGLNELSDAGNFSQIVFRENGGYTNMATRVGYQGRFIDAQKHPDPVEAPKPVEIPPADPAPPVTTDDFKPAPQLEPVPVPGPVPPPGFTVQPSGNVVIDDISKSGIVKKSNVGQAVTAAAGTALTGATAVQAVKGVFSGLTLSDAAVLGLCAVAIVGMVLAFFYFRGTKSDRIDLNKRGIV